MGEANFYYFTCLNYLRSSVDAWNQIKMPKRKLDEVEGVTAFSPMQMKTHVNPRHLGDPRFMKEIYDRTLTLLRAGASKQFDVDGDLEKISALQTPNPSRESSPPSRCLSPLPPDGSVSGRDTPMMCSSGEPSPHKILSDEQTNLGFQLRIDSQGKLTKSSIPQPLSPPDQSRCCIRSLDGMTANCSFCDKVLCRLCSRTCSTCEQNFCSVCSLLEYRSMEEETICLTCQSNEMTWTFPLRRLDPSAF